MANSRQLIAELRAKNYRITKIREAILDLLTNTKKPLSPAEIIELLKKMKILANKTTIYRELQFLQDQRILRSLQLGDTSKYYELTPDNHHHHIVCIRCDSIEDVVLNKDLDLQEKSIAKNKKFKILNHALEFYGICRSCR